jgi:hypothetical protein
VNLPHGLEERLANGDRRMESIEKVAQKMASDLTEVKDALIGTIDDPGGFVAYMKGCEGRVKSLEGWRAAISGAATWAFRIFAGAIITGLAGYMLFKHGIHG